jgi:hypothetical protein
MFAFEFHIGIKEKIRSIVKVKTYTEKRRTLACANQSTIDDRKKWITWWDEEV